MKQELIKFLIKAKKATYAGTEGDSKKILTDGSKEFSFSNGVYSYRDRYFGSDAFAGEEIVFSNDRAIWSLNYYGRILDKTISEKEIYSFLKLALSEVSETSPFRGPKEFQGSDYRYACEFTGDFDYFSGIESIYIKNHKIYELFFHGGIIH